MLQGLIALVLAQALAHGATSDDLIVSPQADLAPPLIVSQQQMIKDLDLLQYAAGHAYAGPDLTNVLQALRAKLPLFSTPQLFCLQLQEQFETIKDSHLRAELVNQGCSLKPRARGQVGENIKAKENTWGATTKTLPGGRREVTVLAIPEFLPSGDPSWQGFLSKVTELKNANQPFILDLRGNSGGDDTMARNLARVLYGLQPNDPVPTPLESRLSRITPEAFALQANAWAVEILQPPAESASAVQYALTARTQTLQWMENAKSGKFPPFSLYQFPQPDLTGKNVFQQPVYVLVDRECASTCELALQDLEALPHRILVGENSKGEVVYGEIGQSVLSESRTIVTLATTSGRFRDYRSVEKVGYAPDISVAPNQDALTEALTLIH